MSDNKDLMAAQAEIDAIDLRVENLRSELQRPNCADREGKRDAIRRFAAMRAEIGAAALAKAHTA